MVSEVGMALAAAISNNDGAAISQAKDWLSRRNIEMKHLGLGMLLLEKAKDADDHLRKKIQSLVDARAAARRAKDFKESDRIRDELAAMGVVLKDSKEGTTWEIAR